MLIHATDPHARFPVARRLNAERLGLTGQIEFEVSDLCSQVRPPQEGFAAIAANLPYIARSDLDSLAPEVRNFEPLLALDGGVEGLELLARLIAEVADRGLLAPGAGLFLEIGIGQAERVWARLEAAGFVDVAVRSDYARIPRIVAGFAPR